MSYPDFPQLIGTARQPVSGIMAERTEHGKIRKRVLVQSSAYDFTVVHELDLQDFDVLMGHYESHKDAFFDFQYQGDGQTYSVTYIQEPKVEWIGGNYRRVTVQLGAEP